VENDAQAIRCSKRQDIVIVACAVSPSVIENVVRGCVANGADYVDITPSASKRALFDKLDGLISSGKSRFILDAGADPGLPGWLVRWLSLNASEDLNQIEAYGRYRSTGIGWGGAADIMQEANSQGWIYDDGWCRAKFWDLRLKKFEGGLGQSLCVPIRLDEFDDLPGELGLQRFKFYHAGLNPVTDALMSFERLAIVKRIPFEWRQRAFYRGLKRYTASPCGLSIEAEGKGDTMEHRAAVGHPDLYRATAVPVVLICEFLLETPTMPAGFGYLGFWASQHPAFLPELQREGFWFEGIFNSQD